MPGLVNYAASPTPSPPPSTKRGEQVSQPVSLPPLSQVKPPRRTPSGIRKLPKPSGSPAVVHPAPSPTIPTGTSAKRRRTSESLDKSEAPAPSLDLPQNLTHTAQSSLPASVLASDPVTTAEEAGEEDGWPGYPGWSDEEVFRRVSRPDEIPGLENWGIPAEVDPEECDDALKAKVSNFLKLKYEKGEHINTRLLSSAAFANPYIYSKLVDFVQISEHGTQFPSAGWLTRRNLESEIPLYGPAATAAQQKAKQDAAKRAQEVGKRKEIAFKPGRAADEGEDRRAGSGGWDSGRGDRGRGNEGRERQGGQGGKRGRESMGNEVGRRKR
ncbi:HCNGP-like protein-domain-containing protein [Dioszegia hungarica]|uniref:HCNGP-like protein-domain-containing protein n=1 Tax=Dioszegia hungarica TaxID=4972 RepID=A0AA38LWG3_9TREE|nr:HCNGP-like protein-domain-containing protein [Dioszegia hungarica]KAI9636614.1 HCNGP-like protein-domain-containing protein [Dioszegia hungarica]